MRVSPEQIQELKQMVNPVDILTGCGGVALSDISTLHDEIRSPCPLHGGDNKTAFSWKKSSGSWVCFSHGCGDGSRDVFGFVSKKMGISFWESVKYIAQLYNYSLVDVGDNESNNKKEVYLYRNTVNEINSAKKYKVENLKELSYLPGYTKSGFETIVSYLESRDYDYPSLKEFKLYPSIDTFKMLRLGIPVYDEEGKLVGINARLMDTIMDYPETVSIENKNLPVPKYRMSKFNKGSALYNLNNAKKHSIREGLIVVEGQFDVMRLHTYGIKNSVCTMGTSLTSQQTSLVYKNSFKICFLVEEGAAAEKGVIASLKQLKLGMPVSIARLSKGDADNNPEFIVKDVLKNSIKLSDGDLKRIINEEKSLPW